jgi:hypothetical protein
VVISWEIYKGKCILSIWENQLIDTEIHNSSVANLFLSKKLNLSSKTVSNFFTILPYFAIFIYSVKIFILSKKSKKFKNFKNK